VSRSRSRDNAPQAIQHSQINGWQRALLLVAGTAEIVVFGLPLIFLGPYIRPYVRQWDPHIYKEYGVARVAVGALLLYGGARAGSDVRPVMWFAALFYALHLVISLYDLAAGNVARIEWAVVGLYAIWVAGLVLLSTRTLPPVE